jgi:hypothetical protein
LIVTWRRPADAAVGFRPGQPQFDDVGHDAQRVAGPHGARELRLAEAGRAQAAGLQHAELEPQLQGHAHRVQARGDQAAVLPLLRELGVDMERLRIPLAGEVDDGGLGEGHAAADEALAELEILEVAIGHRTSSR